VTATEDYRRAIQTLPKYSGSCRGGNRIRQAFIPEEGWAIVSADYSQIELRILAILQDETLINVLPTG